MGAIIGTLSANTEFAGGQKIITVTAPIAAASDTITLTAASHGGVTAIKGIAGATITGGLGATFSMIQVSYSGLVVTVASFEEDGTVATGFVGTTVEIALIVEM